jgi:peroxiredoxin
LITTIIISALLLSPQVQGSQEFGHSKMGSAFDTGMRTRPKKLDGLGNTPFEITAKTPEVQEWFNQGNALLHSFWWEESERVFRWCLKLDPDCAMAYWGLAQGGYNWFSANGAVSNDPKDRYRIFLNEAVKRKHLVSEHERMYIEAWERAFAPGTRGPGSILRAELARIVAKYPNDIEAQTLLAFYSVRGGVDNNKVQSMIDKVLTQNPDHPGAHHASIHLWDFVKPENALKSCAKYGSVAPRIGHALHMPGHAYSKMGMWHEAARAMDAATRMELFYMNDRLALPHESWNYSHNRNYLCYIQEQLGMADASIKGAWELINAPTDPEGSNENNAGLSEGMTSLIRAYIKFERWDDILKGNFIPWGNGNRYVSLRNHAEIMALAGTGKVEEARAKLDQMKGNSERGGRGGSFAVAAEARVLLAEGNAREAIKKLLERAPNESFGGDPPSSPWPLYRLVGDAYMVEQSYRLAVDSYKRALGKEANDGFSLAGMAKAYAALGDVESAKNYAAQFKYEWSNADKDLGWMKEVDALNLNAPAAPPELPSSERPYKPAELANYGPANWQPFAAPELDCTDINGNHVTLEKYRGKNVLLVFYLSESCVHCVEQLAKINERIKDFQSKNTVVLGVSSTPPEKNKESLKLGDFGITLLSDTAHENARRFATYDDFEEMELHSTILINKNGRIFWKRTGGDPFMNIDFLLREIARI